MGLFKKIKRNTEINEKGCWLWKGATTGTAETGWRGDFGLMNVRGKTQSVNRLIWEIVRGPIPKGLMVLHSCDVRRCCNPGHLFLGTPKDSMEEARRKGRLCCGDRHPMRTNLELRKKTIKRLIALPRAKGKDHWMSKNPEKIPRGFKGKECKLTDDKVREIRFSSERGVSNKDLAEKFGVSKPLISQIINWKQWIHLR